MKIFTKSPLFLCIILTFSLTGSSTEIERKIDEFYKDNPKEAIEWIGGDAMTLCSYESMIPAESDDHTSIDALLFEYNITLQLPHCPEIRMIVLKCIYYSLTPNGFNLKTDLYVSGMNGEVLRIGPPNKHVAPLCTDPKIWTILDEVTTPFITRNKKRISSYTAVVNFMARSEKLLEKYYEVYGIVPWLWNPKLISIGMSRVRKPSSRLVKWNVVQRNIVLERTSCTNIVMEVLLLQYKNFIERFVSGLNGEIFSIGRPLRRKGLLIFSLHNEVFGGGHIVARNRKLWGVANVFDIFNKQRRIET